MTILVVEDDKSLLRVVRFNLEKTGYKTVGASDGAAGLETWRKSKPALVIMDVMLPKLDGFELLKAIRKESRVPVLMLTARREEVDRVLGFEIGADDYVTKPFSVRELVARVKAILARAADRERAKTLRLGAVEIDFERYAATVRGKQVDLSAKEYQFLKCLADADGKVVSRDELLEKVWGYDRSLELDTHTIDQHVLRLRVKLGPEAARLATVKGVGYRLKVD